MNRGQGMHGSKDRAIKLLSNSDGVIPLGLTYGHATLRKLRPKGHALRTLPRLCDWPWPLATLREWPRYANAFGAAKLIGLLFQLLFLKTSQPDYKSLIFHFWLNTCYNTCYPNHRSRNRRLQK
ncbi:hypothetical protein BJP36_44335 [Moorena producens JHB]|uniref:Uncharacterized protein n=1 Tax=Moorena producens (strain JHB) TaxID=1454205 RepID=A0A9Q9STL9_MOOP1|nr:hypothetical protein [Moorena producens]WAN69392.1 hypothetical protein BJP36_44335 [Moorena producens JHB]